MRCLYSRVCASVRIIKKVKSQCNLIRAKESVYTQPSTALRYFFLSIRLFNNFASSICKNMCIFLEPYKSLGPFFFSSVRLQQFLKPVIGWCGSMGLYCSGSHWSENGTLRPPTDISRVRKQLTTSAHGNKSISCLQENSLQQHKLTNQLPVFQMPSKIEQQLKVSLKGKHLNRIK